MYSNTTAQKIITWNRWNRRSLKLKRLSMMPQANASGHQRQSAKPTWTKAAADPVL
ncbi:hypothetical protein [Caudoviricetes sp.]|nr:hypothetical protein [Caudoviricetes sp.]